MFQIQILSGENTKYSHTAPYLFYVSPHTLMRMTASCHKTEIVSIERELPPTAYKK